MEPLVPVSLPPTARQPAVGPLGGAADVGPAAAAAAGRSTAGSSEGVNKVHTRRSRKD